MPVGRMGEALSLLQAKLAALVSTKVAVALLGAVLVAGGGTLVALAATQTHTPVPASLGSSLAASGPHTVQSGISDQGIVTVEGVLLAYNSAARTISVRPKDSSAPTIIHVNAQTRITGEHADSLADLARAIGHRVQVQATHQQVGGMLASKITLQGADHSHGHDGHGDDETSDSVESSVG